MLKHLDNRPLSVILREMVEVLPALTVHDLKLITGRKEASIRTTLHRYSLPFKRVRRAKIEPGS